MAEKDWISADEALEALGVKPQTLYAYVSRGQIRAVQDPVEARRSLYSRHDVERLVRRRQRPRRRSEVAAGAISWGEPVLESAVSTVRDGELFFGRERAVDLAARMGLEDVAAHHWHYPYKEEIGIEFRLPEGETARARGFTYLAGQAGEAPPGFGRTGEVLAEEASGLLSGFADALIGAKDEGPLHMRLAQSWGLEGEAVELVRRALVLISDHELNPSTFAVRVAVSTGASLAAGVLAGYATLSGPKHGEASVLVRAHLEEVLAQDAPERAARQLVARPGAAIGFGHPLYPDGDIRAKALMSQLSLAPELECAIAEVERLTGRKANVDVAFAALAMRYDLPREASASLFAIGRTAGWLGHAMEQILSGQLIRPRARFVAREKLIQP